MASRSPGRIVSDSPFKHVEARTIGVADIIHGDGLVFSARRLRSGGRARTRRHAHEARQRRLTDLEFVEPRHDAVDRVVDLHDVERDRGGGPDRDVVMQRKPPAPGERRGDREGERTLDRGEPEPCA